MVSRSAAATSLPVSATAMNLSRSLRFSNKVPLRAFEDPKACPRAVDLGNRPRPLSYDFPIGRIGFAAAGRRRGAGRAARRRRKPGNVRGLQAPGRTGRARAPARIRRRDAERACILRHAVWSAPPLCGPCGAEANGGVDALLSRGTMAGLAANNNGDALRQRRPRGQARLWTSGVRGPVHGHAGIGFGLSEAHREYSLGGRIGLAQGDPGALNSAGGHAQRGREWQRGSRSCHRLPDDGAMVNVRLSGRVRVVAVRSPWNSR